MNDPTMNESAMIESTMNQSKWIGCHQCGLLQRLPRAVPVGGAAICERCRAVLYRNRPDGPDRALALTFAGLILFGIANSFPFLAFEMKGQATRATLLSEVGELFSQGMPWLGALVFLTSFLAPGLLLALLAAVLVPLRRGFAPAYLSPLLRLLSRLTPWVMVEVFLLSILVAMVKLAGMADIELGISLWAIAALMFVLAGILANLDFLDLWERVAPTGSFQSPSIPPAQSIPCHVCGLVNPSSTESSTETGGHSRCWRCDAPLHPRKPYSLQRTWALVIAASICYLPANLLPIMISGYGGWLRADTILGGVVYMLLHGNWGLALIIFLASILVPMAKIVILLYLLISARSHRRLRDRARLYRITEMIGKWSMVDIFVVTIMAALVNLGNWGIVRVGPGAVFFGAVVVLTMLAAMSFDPRLIWDAAEKKSHASFE